MKKQNDKVLTEKVFIDTIKELRETFASKKDLEGLATKDDVRAIVKDELVGYATKEDVREIIKDELTGYPTKEDLKEEFHKFSTTQLAQATIQVLDAVEDLENRIDPKLKNHDKRLTKLELTKN